MPLEVHFLLLRFIVDPCQARLPGRLLQDFVASPQRRFPILLTVILRLEVLAAESRIHRHVVILWLGAGDVRLGWCKFFGDVAGPLTGRLRLLGPRGDDI